MKIVVIDTDTDNTPDDARLFLPKLIEGLSEKGNEVRLLTDAPVSAAQINELNPDIYLIWTAEETGWSGLPRLEPSIATLAVGHADSEQFYAPIRHYRSFLTRVVGTTPEVCVGLVLSCVIDKERVEWISADELEGASASENIRKAIETYVACFEKAIEDARRAPREPAAEFPPMQTGRPEQDSWFSRFKAKILK